jgi:type I restriction enzyme S subunit
MEKTGGYCVVTIKYASISIAEVISSKLRLEANVYNVEARKAKEVLKNCKWELRTITGKTGIATAYRPNICTRIFVNKGDGIPMFTPAQMNEVYPKATKYLSLSTKADLSKWHVHSDQILLTCSGTIGNATIVSKTLDNQLFSQNLIQINLLNKTDVGYLFAFIQSETGQQLLKSNLYGAVIQHIDPTHLDNITIPYASEELREIINSKMMESFALRDRSNNLLKEAEDILIENLKIPPIEKLKPRYYNSTSSLRTFSVKLDDLNDRLDASYHDPIVEKILDSFFDSKASVTSLKDLAKKIFIPGRFKRIYLEDGNSGVPFFSGKCIHELDPSNKKYISALIHKDRIGSQLTIKENMLLITCSGTTGKVSIVPEHWNNWVMTHDIVRLIPKDEALVGYLYVFFSTDFGRTLLQRSNYGSVVPHLEVEHVESTPVALLKDVDKIEQINMLALKANQMRSQAYYLEQEAVRLMNNEVIYNSIL